MPAEKYGYKPTPEISSFGDQLVHVAGITQRFIDTAKGTKTEAAHHGAMAKPEVIGLLKKTFQSAQEMITPLTDAQLLEPVKFPFGDRTVTRATFWQGPLYQIRNHHGQLVVYLQDERHRSADERAAVGLASFAKRPPGSETRPLSPRRRWLLVTLCQSWFAVSPRRPQPRTVQDEPRSAAHVLAPVSAVQIAPSTSNITLPPR